MSSSTWEVRWGLSERQTVARAERVGGPGAESKVDAIIGWPDLRQRSSA